MLVILELELLKVISDAGGVTLKRKDVPNKEPNFTLRGR